MGKKIRTTSRLAYEALVKSGALRGKQALIMRELTDGSPPATSGEILYQLNVRNVNAWRGRFTELRNRGLIREVGMRTCTVTQRKCITWEATGARTATDDRDPVQAGRSEARAWRKFALWMVAQHAHAGGLSLVEAVKEAQRRRLEIPA